MPDFFLDVEGYDPQEMLESQKKMTQSASQGSSGEGVAQIFDKIKSLGDEELVRSVNGVFEFHLEGKEPGVWFVDLKNNSGKGRLKATVLSSALFELQGSKNSNDQKKTDIRSVEWAKLRLRNSIQSAFLRIDFKQSRF